MRILNKSSKPFIIEVDRIHLIFNLFKGFGNYDDFFSAHVDSGDSVFGL